MDEHKVLHRNQAKIHFPRIRNTANLGQKHRRGQCEAEAVREDPICSLGEITIEIV